MKRTPSAAAMHAADQIVNRGPSLTMREIASLIDAELAPLADAERAELVITLQNYAKTLQEFGQRNAASHYEDIARAGRDRLEWANNIRKAADALSRPAPGWDEACCAIVRDAIEGALKVGAPGLHDSSRNAVMLKAMTQIRFMLRQHAQEAAAIARGMKGQGNG